MNTSFALSTLPVEPRVPRFLSPALKPIPEVRYPMVLSTNHLCASVRLRSNNLAYDGNSDGIAGGDYVLGAQQADKFFALFGDTSGDGLVDVAEFGQFRTSFGKRSTDVGYNPQFDSTMTLW